MPNKTVKTKIMQDFATSAQDTGSTQVQVALLTQRVLNLTEHLRTFPKDLACKRGLLDAVARRRRLLRYLKDTDQTQYQTIIEKLDLRK